jgi:serine/threonine-protein kinase HipA
MMADESLDVSADGVEVGSLVFEPMNDEYGFVYDPAWSARIDTFALSPHIPLSGERPHPGTVQRFVANLLPEGRALDVASIHYQLSKSNIFGLIHMLGKEPVGALRFGTRAESAEANSVGPVRRVISNDELSDRIRERDTIPFPIWDGKVRLSVAGYQDKLQVLLEGDVISLADGSLSSTHLLKPETRNPNTPCMVANEHYCMTLAESMRLPVAPVSIRRVPEPILLIERFDRQVMREPASKRAVAIRRLHVIDGCQALDLPVSFKYERNFGIGKDVRDIRDGASFERLFSLVPYLENPAAARTFLVRWAILQLLLGNSDAHGKNVSFFMHNGGLTPTPMYDLVCVNVYGEGVEQELAMAYGDAFTLDEINAFELAYFAYVTRTAPVYLAREMTRMAKDALKFAPALANSPIYVGQEREWVTRVAHFVQMQAEKLLHLAPMIPKVDATLF